MRKLWRILPYLLVVTVQLFQPLVSLSNSIAAPADSPGNLSDEAGKRPPWVRPVVQTRATPQLQPLPRQNISVSINLPSSTTSPSTPDLPLVAYIGNNNLGQSYKDTNNPEDHPGKHFAGPVNLINGNLFLTVGDHFFADRGLSVQFARSYNSLSTENGPIGIGWTHSFNMRVVEDTGLAVTIREADGALLTYTTPGGGSPWTPPAGYFRELTHTAGGPYVLRYKNGLVMNFSALGYLESIVDRNSNTIQLTYDASNRLTQILGPGGEHSLTFQYTNTEQPLKITGITDPLGRSTSYSYDGMGRLRGVTYPEGGVGVHTYKGLDSSELLVVNDQRQARGTTQITQINYDASERVTSVQYGTAGLGSTSFNIAYDLAASSTTWTDGLTTYAIQYDPNYNVTFDGILVGAVWVGEHWLYNPDNLVLNKIDAGGFPTNYSYDAHGNLSEIITPLAGPTSYKYEPLYNNVSSTTNPLGDKIWFTYDAHGNLIKEEQPDGSEINYTVDPFGNLTGVEGSDGATTSYVYDVSGNMLSYTNALGKITTHVYDAVGRVTQTTDPLGRVTKYAYDAADRLVTLTDPEDGTITYTYDSNSNLLTITNANGRVTTNTYDALDRLTMVQDPMAGVTTYTYSSFRLASRTDALAGTATTYIYDAANRLTQRNYGGGLVDQFAYDERGNMIQASNGAYTTQMGYDAENHLITVTLDAPTFTVLPKITYSYDLMGNRTQSVVTDGTDTFTANYTYDSMNRLVQTEMNGRLWTTTYNSAGRRETLTLPDNSHVEYSYDLAGNLTEQRHYNPANSLIRSFSYTYDDVGNTLQEADTDSPIINIYAYDPLNRLINATTSAGAASYSYDPASNLLTAAGPSGINTFTYNNSNQRLTSSDSTYTYDAMGRRTSETGPRGAITYTYDKEMRLTGVDQLAGALQLEYDALGQLIHMATAGTDTFFLRSADRLEAELELTGHLKRIYTIDTEVVSMGVLDGGMPDSFFDVFYDGRGRVRWVTDAASGETVARYSEDPTEDTPGFYNPIRLQGAYFIPEFKLYYMVDGQFWEPYTGLFLFRFRPWAFWPYGPYSSWIPIFHWWPWPWPWARPWGWAWPRPWAFWWPWPGVWVRPFLLWPFWPWPTQPFLPWWWHAHWWGWLPWGHWWTWRPWFWLHGWWFWGWHCGWCWWWPFWWWHWLWWWPCWWIWWVWWGWWGHWWWCWYWWWPWHWPWWGWWWPVYWLPVFPRPPDYGDAPDPLYPSLLASNGARHLNPDYEWLGVNASREFNALITNADTFDDGVIVDLVNNMVTINLNTCGAFWRYGPSTPLNVHGWLDYNGNGDWNDPGEMVVNWSGYPGDGTWPAGQNSFQIVLPIPPFVPIVTPAWARFRLDYAQNIEIPTGPANYGEVEDYHLYDPFYLYLPIIFKPAAP